MRADLQNGSLPSERAIELGIALTEALGHLHRRGLVHRDVKPANVIFVNGKPKLADIGLVTDASDNRSIVGTEGYLSPEGPGTPQADIFALGKVLYEAATGLDRREFPDLPRDVRTWPDAKKVFEINEVILMACSTDLKRRYQSCEEMQSDLVLLERGKSVKQKRSQRLFWSIAKKTGLASGALAVVVAFVSVLPPRANHAESSSDGPDSTNMEARKLCGKAMYIIRGDNYSELGAAYSKLNAAIVLDGNFVRPYVGLLELRVREDVDVPGIPDATRPEMRRIADHLRQLAPHLAATYCAEAVVSLSDWNFPKALRYGAESIRVDPKYELGHTWNGWLLGCCGWPEKSREQTEVGLTLEPSKSIIYRGLGNVNFSARDFTNAIKWYQQAIDLEPHHFVPYNGIGRALQALGDYTNSLDYLQKYEVLCGGDESKVKQGYAVLRHALYTGGISGYWQQRWEWAETDTNTDAYTKAVIQIHLGRTNAALDWLEKSYLDRQHDDTSLQHPLVTILYDEYWDGLHHNDRFRALLEKIGLTKVMPPQGR